MCVVLYLKRKCQKTDLTIVASKLLISLSSKLSFIDFMLISFLWFSKLVWSCSWHFLFVSHCQTFILFKLVNKIRICGLSNNIILFYFGIIFLFVLWTTCWHCVQTSLRMFVLKLLSPMFICSHKFIKLVICMFWRCGHQSSLFLLPLEKSNPFFIAELSDMTSSFWGFSESWNRNHQNMSLVINITSVYTYITQVVFTWLYKKLVK